jgi:hypothetical protein
MARPTQSDLIRALHYNPETGVFTRIIGGAIAGTVGKDNRYRKICVLGKQYYAHRLAWLYMTGEWPPEQVDHRDCDRDNNRWGNLRLATSAQNKWNAVLRKDNRTGLKGVKLHTQYEIPHWVARVRFEHKEHHLGVFNCPVAAHLAYVVASSRLHGEFSRSG